MPPLSASSELALLRGGAVAAQGHRHIVAVVVDRDRRLELFVGVDRDARDRRRLAFGGRLVELQDDLLPLGDRRLAALARRTRRGSPRPRPCSRRWRAARPRTFRRDAFAPAVRGRRLGVAGALTALVTFSGTMRTSIEAKGAFALDGAGRRVGECAERIDARLAGAHQQHLRGERGALSPAAVALSISTTCACASASVSSPVAAAASRRQVALRKRDFRVVLHRRRIGRRIGLFRRPLMRLQRIERRDGVGEAGRRHRQGGREQGVRPRLHHFLVADLDGRGALNVCLAETISTGAAAGRPCRD